MLFRVSAFRLAPVLFLVATLWGSAAQAQDNLPPPSSHDYIGVQIRQALAVPEDDIDYLALTLKFNKLVDPDIDTEAVTAELNKMAEDVLALAGNSSDDMEKLKALREYIYDAGPWNSFNPFAYDQTDPLGRKISNKLIHNYLKSRRGNCVSMPVLFLILGDKIGLDLTLSTAPNHVFVHYHLPDGRVVNIETTSGGNPARNEWIRQNFKMTDAAIKNGLFLKTLSRRQTGAVLAGVVMEHYSEVGAHGYVVGIADALLEVYPELDIALISRGLAFQSMLQMNYLDKYPDLNLVPQADRAFFNYLAVNANASFDRVEALGFVPQSEFPAQ